MFFLSPWNQGDGSNPTGNTPQAYLTILFFDERFNFIPAAQGGVAQQQVAVSVSEDGSILVNNDIKAPKNGYAYIYVSNQSNQDVFFDNLKVQVVTGNIIEENHYYSYGLKIAAISSKKFSPPAGGAGGGFEGTLKNNYLYQGAYSEMDDDIGWNDFALRNYDPQIGRWVQQDPYQEFASPYVGMGNDPVNNVDPSGGNAFSGLTVAGKLLVTTLGGAIIGAAADALSGGDGWTGAAIGAGIGLAGGLINNLTITAKVLQAANVAVTIINTSTNTQQAGRQAIGSNTVQGDRLGHGPNAGGMGDGPDDFIQIDTKSKRVYIEQTDDDYDIVQIDDGPRVRRAKGQVTEKQYRNVGYKIFHPRGVGMGAVDEAIITLVGAKFGSWFFGKIGSWWAGRVARGVLKPLGLGSTGRTAAANLTEQLAMKEIMSNPRMGTVVMEGMKDSRWLGWSKMQYIHRGLDGTKTTIHYVGKFEKGVLKSVDDFKFK